MKRHKKLRYTPGEIWFYLKADEKDDCEELLTVSLIDHLHVLACMQLVSFLVLDHLNTCACIQLVSLPDSPSLYLSWEGVWCSGAK